MPQTQQIVINDGTADVTFSPEMVSSGHVAFQNAAQPNLALRELLHFDRPANDGKETHRRVLRVNVPFQVTDPTTGLTVTKMASFKGECICPADAPASVRKRVRELGSAGLDSTQYTASVETPEWFW